MPTLLEEATTTLSEIVRMHTIYQELLETSTLTMYQINAYAEKNRITLPNQDNILSLINKAEHLMQEIAIRKFTPITDESLHEHRTDADFTEPLERFCYLFVC